MEIQLNKDLGECQEQVLLGLSWRQTIWTVAAVGASIAVFFLAKDSLGTELTTWLCALAALPCAAMGFIKYHGLPFEKLAMLWIRNYIFMPLRLLYRHENRQYAQAKPFIEETKIKEAKRRD